MEDIAADAELVISDQFLGDRKAHEVAERLKSDDEVRTLVMRGNNIGAEGAVALSDMLKVNRGLTSVNLEWNHIGYSDHAMASLSAALEVNDSVRELDLRNNSINHEGARVLSQGLSLNTTLHKLDLRWNGIGDAGAAAIAAAIRSGRSGLQTILLAGNKCSDESVRDVEAALRGETYVIIGRVDDPTRAPAAAACADGAIAAQQDALERQLRSAAERLAELEAENLGLKGANAEYAGKMERWLSERTRLLGEAEDRKHELKTVRAASEERVCSLERLLEAEKEEKRALAAQLQSAAQGADARERELRRAFADAESRLSGAERDRRSLSAALEGSEERANRAEMDLKGVRDAHAEDLSRLEADLRDQRGAIEAQRRGLEERSRDSLQRLEKRLEMSNARALELEKRLRSAEEGRAACERALSELRVKAEGEVSRREDEAREEFRALYEGKAAEAKAEAKAFAQMKAALDAEVAALRGELAEERAGHAREVEGVRAALEAEGAALRELRDRVRASDAAAKRRLQEAKAAQQSMSAVESRNAALLADLEAAELSAEERVADSERAFARERLAFEREVASLQSQLKAAAAELQAARLEILNHDRRTLETLAGLKDAVVEQVSVKFKRQTEGLVAPKPR